jgi:hypothetical protein
LQEKLGPLLEDRNEERGLKTNWKGVESIVSLLTKSLRRIDKDNRFNPFFPTHIPSNDTSSIRNLLKNNDSIVEDLVKV